jgi:hypothetical protein
MYLPPYSPDLNLIKEDFSKSSTLFTAIMIIIQQPMDLVLCLICMKLLTSSHLTMQLCTLHMLVTSSFVTLHWNGCMPLWTCLYKVMMD